MAEAWINLLYSKPSESNPLNRLVNVIHCTPSIKYVSSSLEWQQTASFPEQLLHNPQIHQFSDEWMGEVRRSEEDYSTLEIFRPGIQLVQFLLYITVVRKLEQPPSAQKDPPDTLFFFGGFPDMTHVTVRRIFDDYTKNYAT